MPSDKNDPLANQNIQDRFYGTDDPLAEKILSNAPKKIKKLHPPIDESITSLWIGGIDSEIITEEDIRSIFYIYGEIKGVRLIAEKQIAFVEYESRKQAEKAAEALYEKLEIKNQKLRLRWAEKQGYGSSKSEKEQNKFGLLGAVIDEHNTIKINPITNISSTSSSAHSKTSVLEEPKIPIAPDLFENASKGYSKQEDMNAGSTSTKIVKAVRAKIDGEEGEVEEISDEEDEEDEENNQQIDDTDIFIPPLVSIGNALYIYVHIYIYI